MDKCEQMADFIIEMMQIFDKKTFEEKVKIIGFSEEELNKIKNFLINKIPNLVITHNGDMKRVDEEIKEIDKVYSKGMKPLFLDFSKMINNKK